MQHEWEINRYDEYSGTQEIECINCGIIIYIGIDDPLPETYCPEEI